MFHTEFILHRNELAVFNTNKLKKGPKVRPIKFTGLVLKEFPVALSVAFWETIKLQMYFFRSLIL